VIVYNLDFIGIAVFEAKYDSPRSVNVDGPIAGAIPLKLVQPNASERRQIM
jgi:hypothetical protein